MSVSSYNPLSKSAKKIEEWFEIVPVLQVIDNLNQVSETLKKSRIFLCWLLFFVFFCFWWSSESPNSLPNEVLRCVCCNTRVFVTDQLTEPRKHSLMEQDHVSALYICHVCWLVLCPFGEAGNYFSESHFLYGPVWALAKRGTCLLNWSSVFHPLKVFVCSDVVMDKCRGALWVPVCCCPHSFYIYLFCLTLGSAYRLGPHPTTNYYHRGSRYTEKTWGLLHELWLPSYSFSHPHSIFFFQSPF